MTYEENKLRIAEKMAIKYLPAGWNKLSAKEQAIRIGLYQPLAELCLREMAESYSAGYTRMNLHSRLGKELTPKWAKELKNELIINGLNDKKQ